MGKKHVIATNQEEAIKEQEKIDKTAGKEVKVKSSSVGVQEGKVYVSSSYNNTIVTLTNSRGQVLAWKSAGSVGFKGTKKSTSFAASRVAETIAIFLQIFAIASATLEAANDVAFLAPLNPTEPADFHAKTFPLKFVRVTIVLL